MVKMIVKLSVIGLTGLGIKKVMIFAYNCGYKHGSEDMNQLHSKIRDEIIAKERIKNEKLYQEMYDDQ